MNIVKRIIIILISLFCIVNIINIAPTFAIDLSSEVGGFEANITDTMVNQSASLRSIVNRLLGFLQVISGLILIVVIGTSGYEYIVATPPVKEELKKKMLPIILGLILLFSAVSIAQFIMDTIGG